MWKPVMPTGRSKWGPVHVGQGAISAIELVEDAVAIRANPEPVEPSDSQRCVIQQRKSSCLIINQNSKSSSLADEWIRPTRAGVYMGGWRL
jgi:hypothetical protein